MNTNITTQAVVALNKSKNDTLVEKVMAKMIYIGKEQAQIEVYRKEAAAFQKTVAAMADDVITPEQVFGRPASLTPTPNEVVILEALKKRNEDKAKSIANNAKNNVDVIDGIQNSIKGCEGRIAEIRAEINKMTVEEVTVATIMG